MMKDKLLLVIKNENFFLPILFISMIYFVSWYEFNYKAAFWIVLIISFFGFFIKTCLYAISFNNGNIVRVRAEFGKNYSVSEQNYLDALYYLRLHPEDQHIRPECIKLARIHYNMKFPNISLSDLQALIHIDFEAMIEYLHLNKMDKKSDEISYLDSSNKNLLLN